MSHIAASHLRKHQGARGPQAVPKQFSILALLLFISLASPLTFDLPLTPSKLQNGINITTEDWGAQIYPNHTLHYYVMRIPTRSLNVDFTAAHVERLMGSAQIDQLLLYPIQSERPYFITRNWGGGSVGNTSNFTITENRIEYTTGAATNRLRTSTSRAYIVEARTANFMEGAWGSAALGFDPNVTACGTLATAGAIYTMNQSITAGAQHCINFGAQNITFDCQGYSLKSTAGGFTFNGIFSNRTNTTILNCNVSNFGNQIVITNMNRLRIDNSNITESTQGAGMLLSGVHNASITNINFTGNAAYNFQTTTTSSRINLTNATFHAHGVYTPLVLGGTDIIIKNLTVLNSTFGIYWEGTTNGRLEGCHQQVGSYSYSMFNSHNINTSDCWTNVSTAYSSAYPAEAGWWGAYYSQTYPTKWVNITMYSERVGFLLSEFALDTLIINSTIIVSGERAIDLGSDGSAYIYGSTLIAKNQTYYNSGTEFGILENNYIAARDNQAVVMTAGYFTTFINNTFENNGSVVVDIDAQANTFINNTFKSRNATLLRMAASSYDNLFYWNNFTNTTGLYVNDSAGNQYNTTMATNPTYTLETSGLALSSVFAQTLDVGEKICMTATKWLVSFGKNGGNSETGVLQYANHTDIATTAFSGDIATFSPTRQLTSGQCYWLMTRSSAGDRDRHYTPFSSYPLAGTYLTWETSYNGAGDDATNFIEIYNLTLTTPNQTHGEGNIWANVLNGSAAVQGTELSRYGSGLLIGTTGAVPYNNSSSIGKFTCNFAGCADYAPLTPTPPECLVNISYSPLMTPDFLIITRYTNPSWLAHFFTTYISHPLCPVNITAYIWQANNSALLASANSLINVSWLNTTGIPTGRAIKANVTISTTGNSSTTETRTYYLLFDPEAEPNLNAQVQAGIYIVGGAILLWAARRRKKKGE